MRFVAMRNALLAGLTGAFAAAAGAAWAAPLPEVFPLGQSGASGAVCEAVRDYQDPLGQGADARAWRIRCRGYSTVLGRIYQLPAAQKSTWQTALGARVECAAAEAAPAACREPWRRAAWAGRRARPTSPSPRKRGAT